MCDTTSGISMWVLSSRLNCELAEDRDSPINFCLSQEAEKAMAPTPVPLPGEPHGRRSLVGCSPWGRKELDTTERHHFPFSLSCIGEGNGNPLQCSCLESPRDGGAWWAAVYGVPQGRTRLKRLSSSSSSQEGPRCPAQSGCSVNTQ